MGSCLLVGHAEDTSCRLLLLLVAANYAGRVRVVDIVEKFFNIKYFVIRCFLKPNQITGCGYPFAFESRDKVIDL